MALHRAEQIKQIRDRLIDRAAASSPLWSVPVFPSARNTANALMMGCLLSRLPDEDATALCTSILEEQNENGSWSKQRGDNGDISVTLEVLEALSLARLHDTREAIDRSIRWIEQHRVSGELEWESLLLLGAVNDSPRHRWTKLLGSLLDFGFLKKAIRKTNPASKSVKQAYHILSTTKDNVLGQHYRLIELQRPDGSWDGLTRVTTLALTALRHTGLPNDDAAIERGWRFLRGQQHWSTTGLVQNPCDFSTFMHASAIRALVSMGATANDVAGSILSLLHAQRASGGWGIGSQLPTDTITTSLTLNALSAVGDHPIETGWSRRRAEMLLLSTQHRDGGWPLYLNSRNPYTYHPLLVRSAGSPDASAMALIALAANESTHPDLQGALSRAVAFLTNSQQKDGFWASDIIGNDLCTTSRAIEALSCADTEGSRRAILKGIRVLREKQHADGGWGVSDPSTPAETAWVVRALQRIPGLYKHAISQARDYLMHELDSSGLVWNSNSSTFPIPFEDIPVELWDLTTMWALEAYSPAPRRTPRITKRRAKSIFDRRT
ncbi:hypothetical protein KKH18_11485 [bacterium]|nr:hypothetical protein [bacterium]